jgi:tetratricopeptide (TPR) repeat protein
VTRALLALPLAAALWAAPPKPEPPKDPAEPAEEDASLVTKEHTFNPLQATKEIQVGQFYMKKGAYKSAALRFEEATKWNPQLPEAWLRLGEAREKLKDTKGMREAYEKYLELDPEAKDGKEIRKKLNTKKN